MKAASIPADYPVASGALPAIEQATTTTTDNELRPPLPPRRLRPSFEDENLSNPIHYTRDPHKLVAYLVPFPKPTLKHHFKYIDPTTIPDRFLIYTPPPPPLRAPAEGEKEAKFHKVQRKWENEVRAAKTSDAKTMSWKGAKSKATRGISTAMSWTKSSNLEFLNRVNADKKSGSDSEEETTHKTVGLEEMVLVYPASTKGSPEEMRVEFVNSMMRSKSQAQKDTVIATGLLPVSFAIDVLATVVWPFGGLLEIDSVWAYSSFRGAKTARSVTKRLSSSGKTGDHDEDKLKLEFTPSPRLEILRNYLAAQCHHRDPKAFPPASMAVTETDVLEAIGWSPSQSGGETRNWEDEQWETTEVKDDLKATFNKAAREWDKWTEVFAKDPEKAMKK